MDTIFTKLYETAAWGNNANNAYSGSSGEGSSIEYNLYTYIPFVKKFIRDNGITTIVDLGCGDFRCGPLIYNDLHITYTGYDTYKKVVDHNETNCAWPKFTFFHLDFFHNRELIKGGDLCILKDVIQHWSLADIHAFLDYLVASNKFRYIMIINCGYQTVDNADIKSGEFRPLSCDFLPLKKYNAAKVYAYHTKEISVITN